MIRKNGMVFMGALILIAIGGVHAVSTAATAAWSNCQQATTTAAMQQCASLELQKADQELNRQYKSVMGKVEEKARRLVDAGLKNPGTKQ